MELRRTHCEKFLTDDNGKIISVVEKKKYKTMEKAQLAADEQNVMKSRTDKINPYQCFVCKEFHVGRTGEKITFEDIEGIYERRFERRKANMPSFKVVGKIDLSKVPLSNKDRRRMEKEKRKQKEKKERELRALEIEAEKKENK